MTTILKGDCLEVMKGIADKSVDLIICDLPYGCLVGGGNKENISKLIDFRNSTGSVTKKLNVYGSNLSTGCSWDIKLNLEIFWKEIKRIRRDDHTPTIHFCTTKFGNELINSNPKEFRYDLVWDKQRGVSFLSANKMPMRSHEMIYVFSKAGANYNRVDIEGDFPNTVSPNHKRSNISNTVPRVKDMASSNEGKRCMLSVINNVNKIGKGNHPTQKPIDLYKFLIQRYSNTGDTVLDPTFGSGNSGEACKELNRRYIGIEKDEKFFWKYASKNVARQFVL